MFAHSAHSGCGNVAGCLGLWGINLSITRNSPRSTWCFFPQGWVRLTCKHSGTAWAPIRCRNCQGCDTARVAKGVARVWAGMEAEGNGRDRLAFLTLTTTPSSSWPSIMSSWSKLWRRLKRRTEALQYIVVKEEGHETGMKHLHIVLRGWEWMPWATLVRWWQELEGARGVFVERVKDKGRAAGYLAKYLAKGLGQLGVRKSMTNSKGWPSKREGGVVAASYSRLANNSEVLSQGRYVTDRGLVVAGDKRLSCGCFGDLPVSDGDRMEIRLLSWLPDGRSVFSLRKESLWDAG